MVLLSRCYERFFRLLPGITGLDVSGMMSLQEMIMGLDELSLEEQVSLLSILQKRLAKKPSQNYPESFWEMTLRFRERMQKEGIEFTDEDFADLRDRSPGREVYL